MATKKAGPTTTTAATTATTTVTLDVQLITQQCVVTLVFAGLKSSGCSCDSFEATARKLETATATATATTVLSESAD